MSELSWSEVVDQESIDANSVILQEMVLKRINQFIPQKKIRIANDDQPWVNEDVKRWKRKNVKRIQNKKEVTQI